MFSYIHKGRFVTLKRKGKEDICVDTSRQKELLLKGSGSLKEVTVQKQALLAWGGESCLWSVQKLSPYSVLSCKEFTPLWNC